jgi:hypothetical protein
VGHLKYLLVIVDHLTNWVEVILLPSATANGVVKALLKKKIILRFVFIENTDSDNGSHFTANVVKELTRPLAIRWEYHTSWHPPSEKVKRMNQILKRQLTKLVLETKLPWTKCLSLALLRIRMAPQKDIGFLPFLFRETVYLLLMSPRLLPP